MNTDLALKQSTARSRLNTIIKLQRTATESRDHNPNPGHEGFANGCEVPVEKAESSVNVT